MKKFVVVVDGCVDVNVNEEVLDILADIVRKALSGQPVRIYQLSQVVRLTDNVQDNDEYGPFRQSNDYEFFVRA
jgi:hypothetical protein